MRDRPLDRLFLRYRDEGDLEALEQVFEATAPALLSLGRHLLGHAQDTEDALQATYLTAIERSGQFDPARPLEPWLFGIFVRQAKRTRAGSTRPLEPDRLHVREVEDPSAPASEQELRVSLLDAIEELPEAYRRVLDPYLQAEEAPRAIAERLGQSSGAIRVRIHRGLALLRKALPAGLAFGTAGALVSRSSELDRVRDVVLARAKSFAIPPATPWSLAAMGSTLAVRSTAAAAVAVALLSVWTLTRPEEVEPTLGDPDAQPTLDNPGLGMGPALEGPEGSEGRLPRHAEGIRGAVKSNDSDDWTLTLRVTGFEGSAGVPLSLLVHADGNPTPVDAIALETNEKLERILPRDPDAVEGEAPPWSLSLDHPAYAPIRLPIETAHFAGEGRLEIDVPLLRKLARITGRVELPQGSNTRAGIFPWPTDLEPGDAPWVPPSARSTHDDSGHFELLFEPVDGTCVVAHPGALPFAVVLEVGSPWDIDLGTVELQACHRIEGSAYDNGAPSRTPGLVTARSIAADGHPKGRLGDASFAFVDGDVLPFGSETFTDADGRFVLDGLARGDHAVLYVPPIQTSGFYHAVTDGTRVTAPATGVVLETPIRIYTIELRSQEGPVPHAMVLYTLPGGSSVSAPTDRDGQQAFYYASTSPPIPIVVSKPGYRTLERSVRPSDFGPDLRLEIPLERTEAPARLTMNLQPPRGAPFGAATLRLRLLDSTWSIYHPVEAGGARIEFPEIPAGTYELSIDPEVASELPLEQQARWTGTKHQRTLAPGDEVTWDLPLSPGGRVRFLMGSVDPGDTSGWSLSQGSRHVSSHFLVNRGDGSGVRTIHVPGELPADSAPWLLSPLPPGDLSIRLNHGGRPIEVTVPIVAGDVTDVDLARN